MIYSQACFIIREEKLMKKRIFGIMLVLVMVVSMMTACGTDEVVGDWSMTKIGMGGEAMTIEDFAKSMGGSAEDAEKISINLNVNEDGTFKMEGDISGEDAGEATKGEWEATDDGYAFIVDGEKVNATLKDGELELAAEEDGFSVSLVFEKK